MVKSLVSYYERIGLYRTSLYGGGGLKGFIKITFSGISYKFIMEFSIFRDFMISFHVFAGKNFPGGLDDPPPPINSVPY